MRTVEASVITEEISKMCIEANYHLSKDMMQVFGQAKDNETSPLGKKIFDQLCENLKIADTDTIPICQDTGLVWNSN